MFTAFDCLALKLSDWKRLLWAALLAVVLVVLSGCASWQTREEAGRDGDTRVVSQTDDFKAKSEHSQGNEDADETEADDDATEQTAGASFDLQIHAPRDIRRLLLQHMELQNYRMLSDLRPSELNRLAEAAPANIGELLATLGYFQPQIAIQVHHPEKSQKNQQTAEAALSQVIVSIEPGPQARVQTAELEFAGSITRQPQSQAQMAQLRSGWGLESGAAFTQDAWQSAKSETLSRLQGQRYPTASIAHSSADIVLPPDGATQSVENKENSAKIPAASARLSVQLDSGPLYRFGPLVIEGAQRYNPAGAVRLSDLPVGEEYDRDVLLDAQQRLVGSGLYDSVFLTLDTDAAPEGQDEVQVPVVAQVREAPLKKWVYGLGYSTDSGPRFSLEYTHNRITDMQLRAVSKIQINRKNPSIASSVHSLPDHTGWNWFAGVQLAREELASYQLNTASVQAGRSRTERKIDRTWALRYEWAGPRSKERGQPDVPPTSSSIMASYGWTGRYFNNPYTPTSGWGFAWEAGVGTTLMPRRDVFTRVAARTLHFIPVGERGRETKRRSRLALRASAGALTVRDQAQVPLTQLFLSGGDTTVRGYAYQSIGAHTQTGRTIGGRYMATLSVEWQRPIVLAGNRQDWEHTLFVDAGAVHDEAAGLLKRDNIYSSVGTGIRWNSPVGPLQADLAWGVKTRKTRLHLRLGFNF